MTTPALLIDLRERKAELLLLLRGDCAAAAGSLLARWCASGLIDDAAYWDWGEWFEERAAILEYEAGRKRPDAERAAYEALGEELARINRG